MGRFATGGAKRLPVQKGLMQRIAEIRCIGGWEQVNSENDNVDVHVHLDDGLVYSFLVATPNNVFWCMENEGIDYFFGTPPLFVRVLTRECVEKAITAVFTEDDGRWLAIYGSIQVEGEQ